MTNLRVSVVLALSALLCACPATTEPACDGGACTTTPTTSGGCDAGAFQTLSGECRPVGAQCGAGLRADPSGWGCEAVIDTCDAGAISVPGEGCTRVGWTTCPAGFTATGTTCEPVLPNAPCTGATRASLGSTTCAPIGDCDGVFPPAAATLFVDATLDGGDAKHFPTLTAALAAAPAGATIAIAAGTYREAIAPTRPVKLIGRCAARVQLIGSPAVFVDGVIGVELEGVTVRDSILAARVERGGALTLRHAVLEANLRSAVQATDANTRVTLEDVVVRNTAVDPATQTFGQGVAASFGAKVTLTDVELLANREVGLFLDRAQTTATVNRTVITDTQPRTSTGKLGWGVGVQRGASLTATALVVQDSRVSGVVVTEPMSVLTLTDSVVRRTRLGLDNAGAQRAIGVAALQGATFNWTGGLVDGSEATLVRVADVGTTATLRDVTARSVTPSANVPASGISVEDSAKLTLDHVALFDAAGTAATAMTAGELKVDHLGVFGVSGVGLRAQAGRLSGVAVEVRGHSDIGALALERGNLDLSRCVIADGTSDDGLGAATGELGLVTLERCLLTRNVTAGIYARESGAAAIAANTVISETRLDAAGEFGQGVIAEHGASASLIDVTVSRNHTAGLQTADQGSVITAQRVTVRSTQPNATGKRGRGGNANFGGRLEVLDSAVIDNQQVGLFTFQSQISVSDSLVLGTRADPDGSYGNGLEALTDGSIVFTRGVIEQSTGIAAVYAEGAGVLDGARVVRNAIGLHAQDGSTVEELATAPGSLGARQVAVTSSTRFEDNQAKLSAVTVPVPAP